MTQYDSEEDGVRSSPNPVQVLFKNYRKSILAVAIPQQLKQLSLDILISPPALEVSFLNHHLEGHNEKL